MQSLLLMLALCQVPEAQTVVVFSQREGCAACDYQQRVVPAGTYDGLSVSYVYVLPSDIAVVPTLYDPRTKRRHEGAMTLAEIKKWIEPKPLASDDAAHTPLAEVTRVLDLLPRPQVGFVDFGCGYDARWCVAAVERWGCRVTGVELNPERAAEARKRVYELGLSHLITIIEGDATTVSVSADVGVAYLYPDVLARLRPNIERLTAFASYMHQPPGLTCVKNGDTWFYTRAPAVTAPVGAVWGGYTYTAPQCNNPNCAMCNSIRSQLAARVVQQPQATGGRYVKMKFCNGRQCWYQDVWVP